MRALLLVLLVGCPPVEPEAPSSNPSGCAAGYETGDWAAAAAERCVSGQVVERLHHVPKDAPGGLEGPPMEGVSVWEYRGGETATSGEEGRFVLQLEREDLMGVMGGDEGRVNRAFVQTWSSFADSGRGVEVDLPEQGHELELYEETFGVAWDPEKAAVYVHFYNPGGDYMWEASATFDSGEGPLVYAGEEELEPGNVIPEFSPDTQVLHADVEPGDHPLGITSPPGYVCDAPDVVPVLPDVMLDVWVTCLPE